MIPKIFPPNLVNVVTLVTQCNVPLRLQRYERSTLEFFRPESRLRCGRRAISLFSSSSNTQAVSTDDTQTIPFTFSHFSNMYSGDFCNDWQLAQQPDVQYARKLHIPVHAPELGENCFFVKEETRRTNQMQYRLRIAVFSLLRLESGIGFRGKHYDFRDPSPLEAELSLDEYIAQAQVSHELSASRCT